MNKTHAKCTIRVSGQDERGRRRGGKTKATRTSVEIPSIPTERSGWFLY